MLGLFEALGLTTVLLVIVLVAIIPIVLTIIVGAGLANYFELTGITWWAFMILFYIIVTGLLGLISV